MKTATAWLEFIPGLCADSYAMSEAGVYLHSSREEIETDIASLEKDWKEQIEAGDRDPEDGFESESEIVEVTLHENGSIFVGDCDITADIHRAMARNDITDLKPFQAEIKSFIETHS